MQHGMITSRFCIALHATRYVPRSTLYQPHRGHVSHFMQHGMITSRSCIALHATRYDPLSTLYQPHRGHISHFIAVLYPTSSRSSAQQPDSVPPLTTVLAQTHHRRPPQNTCILRRYHISTLPPYTHVISTDPTTPVSAYGLKWNLYGLTTLGTTLISSCIALHATCIALHATCMMSPLTALSHRNSRPPRTSPHRRPHHVTATRSDLTTDHRFRHFPISAPVGGTAKAGGRPPRFCGVDPRTYRSAPVPAVRTDANR